MALALTAFLPATICIELMPLATTCPSKLTLTWNGPCALCAEEVNGVPAHVGGVYVLAAFCPDYATLQAFYVGQSAALQRRLTEHLKGKRTFARVLRGQLSTYFVCANVSDPLARAWAEAALIRHFEPAGNTVHPAAPPLVITLPNLQLLSD